MDQWAKYFPGVDFRPGVTGIEGDRRGETMVGIHERVERALERIIQQADKDGLKTMILCTHAATNIALGRALMRDPNVIPWNYRD